MSEIQILRVLREQLDLLLNQMCEVFPTHKSDIIFVKTFFETLSAENIMKHIKNKVLPWKEKIEKRDRDFFINNKGIFGEVGEDRVDFYSEMVKKGEVDDETIETIFEFFTVYIALAESHEKLLKKENNNLYKAKIKKQ